MSAIPEDLRPPRETANYGLPIPGDVAPADYVTDTGDLADAIDLAMFAELLQRARNFADVPDITAALRNLGVQYGRSTAQNVAGSAIPTLIIPLPVPWTISHDVFIAQVASGNLNNTNLQARVSGVQTLASGFCVVQNTHTNAQSVTVGWISFGRGT